MNGQRWRRDKMPRHGAPAPVKTPLAPIDMTEKEAVAELKSLGYEATTSASKAMVMDMLMLARAYGPKSVS